MRAPSDLLAAGRRLWTDTVKALELEPHERRLLLECCRVVDELEAMRKALVAEPATVPGSNGQPRPNPLFSEARAHREQLARLLAALALPDSEGESTVQSLTALQARRAARVRWSKPGARRGSA